MIVNPKIILTIVVTIISINIIFAEPQGDVSVEFEYAPYYRWLNKDSKLNPNNVLGLDNIVNEGEASLKFSLYDSMFDSFAVLKMSSTTSTNISKFIDDNIDKSEVGHTKVELSQFKLEFYLPYSFTIGYGKLPYNTGYARVHTPLNYVDVDNSFFNEDSDHQLYGLLSLYPFDFRFIYFPLIKYKANPNDKNDTERFLSSFESRTKRNMMVLNMKGFFLNRLETQFNVYMKEKTQYAFDDFYFAYGGGFSIFATDNLIIRAEALYGNGFDNYKDLKRTGLPSQFPQYEFASRDLDKYYFKGLVGTTFTPFLLIEFSIDYYYNGSGMSKNYSRDMANALDDSREHFNSGDALLSGAHTSFIADGVGNFRLFNVSQHYIFFQTLRRGIFDDFEFNNVAIILPVDTSLYNLTTISYFLSDRIVLETEVGLYWFDKDDVLSLSIEGGSLLFRLQYNI